MNSKFYYYLWFVLGDVGLLLTASLIIYCHINNFPALSIYCFVLCLPNTNAV